MKFLILLLLCVSCAAELRCTYSDDCPTHATCVRTAALESHCDCNEGYVTHDGAICGYQQKSQLTTFLLSFFVGYLGADWFYLCDGDAGYIVAGVFKLITCGGLGIWWIADWIRVLVNDFPDGNGVGLEQDM